MIPSLVFNTYWHFAAERQRIFFNRLHDPLGPWTADPILMNYRFTNAYRASDRVSQYLIQQVQYHPDRDSSPDEIFFRTMLFKFFNRIETWEAIENTLGPQCWETVDFDGIKTLLDQRIECGKRNYSAAYIMPAPKFGHVRKHANHLTLLKKMMDDRLPGLIQQAPSLSDVYEFLVRYSGIGPFLAFQYTIDLNYSDMLEHEESSFVVAGPGAIDGIAKCFTDLSGLTPEEVIFNVCENQENFFEDAGIKFPSLFGRRLQPIDCQNLFCEISKYARVAHPGFLGRSGRTRIKQSYKFNPQPLPIHKYPPRWNLDCDISLESSQTLEKQGSRVIASV